MFDPKQQTSNEDIVKKMADNLGASSEELKKVVTEIEAEKKKKELEKGNKA